MPNCWPLQSETGVPALLAAPLLAPATELLTAPGTGRKLKQVRGRRSKQHLLCQAVNAEHVNRKQPTAP